VSLIRRAFEQRHLTQFGPLTADRIPTNGEVGTVNAGVAVTDQTALQLVAFYACVRLLADSIASLPWDAFRKQGDLRREVDPEPSLLREPFSEVTDFEWKHMLVVSLAMRGNFYGFITERDWLGHPTQIKPLHPDSVRVDREPETGRLRVWVNGDPHPYSSIFHLRAFTLPGQDVGLSPVQMARQSLGLGLAAEQFGAKWFRDGAAPSSVLQTDQNLDADQVAQAQQQWITSHGGRRLPAVLTGGFEWKPVTITPDESQFIETRKMQVSEIARMFGIPPHMIGDVEKSTSWGTGIEQQSIGFVTYTLRPWLTRIETSLTKLLPRGQFVKFNVDGLLRGDIKSRYEAHRIAIEAGFKNPDEARAHEDMPPIPDGLGQQFRQPLNFGPLGADPRETEGTDDER
jgi:HK97 family phage portal protein